MTNPTTPTGATAGVDLDKLEALARAATPGPWLHRIDVANKGMQHCLKLAGEHGAWIADCLDNADRSTKGGIAGERNAQFIAAANPATILALVDLARRAEPRVTEQADELALFEAECAKLDIPTNSVIAQKLWQAARAAQQAAPEAPAIDVAIGIKDALGSVVQVIPANSVMRHADGSYTVFIDAPAPATPAVPTCCDCNDSGIVGFPPDQYESCPGCTPPAPMSQAPAATDQPSAGQVDERALFEAWILREFDNENWLKRYNIYDPDNTRSYKSRHVSDMWDGWQARASLTPTAPQAASQQAELYTCIGKGGEYELLGTAKGAGTMRDVLVCDLTIYRDTTTGQLYHRAPDDFAARMERAPQAATTASASQSASLADAVRAALDESNRGTSGRIIIDAGIEQTIRAALARAPLPAKSGELSNAEFLSKRLSRVAKLVGAQIPEHFTHEQVAEVAGTILGEIARKLESTASARAVDVARDADEPTMLWDAKDPEDGTHADSPMDFAREYVFNSGLVGEALVDVLCAYRGDKRTMRIVATDDQAVTWSWADAAMSRTNTSGGSAA